MNFSDLEKQFLQEKLRDLRAYLVIHATSNQARINEVFSADWDTMVHEFPKHFQNKTPEKLATQICVTLGIPGFTSLLWRTPSVQRVKIQTYVAAFAGALQL